MPDALRVALVDHSARMGGAEWSLLNLVSALDRGVVDPVVVLGEDGPLAGLLRAQGTAVEIVPFERRLLDRRKDDLGAAGLARPDAVASLGRAVAALRGAFSRLEVRVVHTNSLKAHVAAGLAGRLVGARVLWHVRDRIAEPYLPGAAVRALRLAAARVPHRVVAVSRSAARTVGREDVRVLHQSVRLPERMPPRVNGSPRVGIVGRISPWKGQDVFLDAAARLAPDFPGLEFVLAGGALFGEADFERELRARAACLLLDGRVRFLGPCDDVWPVYRSLDVAVHASTLPEPYGNVILEAMAAETPVVATAAGGALELVDDGRTGVLVPPGDAGALADALRALLRDPARRTSLARAAREHVERRFSAERDARAIEALYRELVA